MACENESCQTFDSLSLKFSRLLYERNEKQQQQTSSLLDELNNLNYKSQFITNNNKAVLLIHQFCTIVPPSDSTLVEKCCKLIVNLITLQYVNIEGRTLSFATEWAIQILKQSDLSSNIAVLKCLESLIRDNVHHLHELLSDLIGRTGILIRLATSSSLQEIQLWAVKCLEAITYTKEEQVPKTAQLNAHYLDVCAQIFLQLLIQEKHTNCDEVMYCKLLISSLRGLQSIILQNTDVANNELAVFLGISRCYMTYFLYDANWVKPQKIMPSNLSVADLKTNITREKKGGKITKQRKQRKTAPHKKDDGKRSDPNSKSEFSADTEYTPATLFPENTIAVISDSDFSDSETGKSNKIAVTQGRVRQAALNLLLCTVKVIDKHVMFGYWSSFFPDGSFAGVHSLNQCLLKEPSPRGRIAVLNVISTILNGSKLYLSQAESSEKTFAFTPFSMMLGAMVHELHQCLCLALNENYIPVLTQTLKCIALLVQATPYHRLSAGLITNIVKNIKPLIRHRDATVQVAALIVLGCVLASEPTILETQIMLLQISTKTMSITRNKAPRETDQEIEYAAFSSDDEDQTSETNSNVPWLLEKCLRNLGVIYTTTKRTDNVVPAPVKLESLQVVSAMCRNYFHIMLAPHIMQVAKALEISLSDKYMDLRLHAGRAVDSIGHSMQQHFASSDEPKALSIDKGLVFWQILLNGPLTALLQSEKHATLRAIGCDCLGNIGSDIFEHLPKDKQILVITLLFACSRDEENSVKGAAVRALAISVLYPSLREDLGFVMDTAEAIIRNLEDVNLTVRIKSSWSLGNLSDALVLYKNGTTNEDLPNSLIVKLLSASIKIAEDNNKIKSNAARALGNLLRLISTELLEQNSHKLIVEQAIAVLVTNANSSLDMKVRWNSCYAIGNFMKNNDLFIGSSIWQHNVFRSLMDLVVNFRNFKVRINAALAMAVPEKRTHYGHSYFDIWQALLNSLDNTQNIEEFSEFKHRDNLIDQLCLSLSHLVNFLTSEDLNTLMELMVSHVDTLKTHMHRVQERLVPEKSETLVKATNHIVQLQAMHLSNEENTVVNLLKNVFITDNPP